MVKVSRAQEAELENAARRVQDICGLLLFFLGAACLVSLSWKQEGILPEMIAGALRFLAGSGAFVIPLLLMFAGTMFLIGYQRLSFSHSSAGSILLFLIFVTGRHLWVVPRPAEWTGPQIQKAGGWIGGLLGSSLYTLLGNSISAILLVVLTAIAIVLLADQPFVLLIRQAHARYRAGADLAKQKLERNSRSLPGREALQKPAAALAVTAGPADRSERASRVVERALVAAQSSRTAPPEPQQTEEDDNEHEEQTTSSKLWSLFHMTRGSWRENEPQDPETSEIQDAPETEPVSVSGRTPPVKEITEERSAEPEKVRKPVPKATAPAEEPEIQKPKARPQNQEAVQLILPEFALPPLTLLKESPVAISKRSQAELTDNVQKIEQTLEQFNIGANVMEVASGPSVTRYEVQLAPGIKVSKIVSLADNLAMSLAAIDVRVEAPIPGKSAIGVEVPNATPVTVSLRECLEAEEFQKAPSKLTFALGKDVSGQYKYADLTRMPHLLIGGSTNSGKSVCLNVIIASLVYRASPREVKMLMIDPKRVELSLWEGIPHLMHPVVKDVQQAAGIFRVALKEMDRRYDMFATLGTRNIDGYNQRVPESEKLPYIVLIVDELADLMMQQGPEVETSICRLAQLARATGIHLVIATQRPSVDIITGTIKANIASRIAFAVASQVDSRTILDMTGADRLIGRGDMLFMPIDAAKPLRIQGAYLSEQETNTLVQYLKQQEKPEYSFSVSTEGSSSNGSGGRGSDDDVDDAFFEQAVRLVVNNGQASTSMLQRRFRIGYTRAARIVEMMEERGIVGALNGAKPREILVSKDEVERMFNPGGPIPSVEAYQDDGE